MFMWFLKPRYGPYKWSRTSQAFYCVLNRFIKRGESVLEFGSSTGHISFRMAREGHRITLLDIRQEPVNEARQLFAQAGVTARFITSNFLEHHEPYDALWNSGLIQCITQENRELMLMHATSLSKRLLLFYPDTDSLGKVRGANPSTLPGVNDALEYSVVDLPEVFCRYFNKVYWGRLPGDKLALPFDMLWLQGNNTCESD
jgi:hypothetical protein